MKSAVKVELISLVLFLAAFASLYYLASIANILIWVSLGLSHLCFLVEFLPKYKAHKMVALEHGTFGFLFYLLSVPVIYLSNCVMGWPDAQTVVPITFMLLLPVVVSKMVVIFSSLRKFDEIDWFWSVAFSPLILLSNNLYSFILLFCATTFVSTTTLLRSHDYFGFDQWVSLSTSLFLWSTLAGVLSMANPNVYDAGMSALLVFTLVFLFESALSVRYRAVKDNAVGKLMKQKKFSGLAKAIEHRYNLSLTLLAHDLVQGKRDIGKLGIVKETSKV